MVANGAWMEHLLFEGLFFKAIKFGNLATTKYLLDNTWMNYKLGYHVIEYATLYGHIEFVEFVLNDERFNSYTDMTIAFQNAARSGYTNIAKLLLNDTRHINISADKNMAIRHAVQFGHTEIVELILKDKRFNISLNDNNNLTLLATEKKYNDIVELLSNL
jgi:ankyrin repeat protein